jgi:hypothetical protein
MPRETISFVGRPSSRSPFQVIEPEAGLTSPTIALRVVDFPAPFAPIKVTILPSGTSRETPCRA